MKKTIAQTAISRILVLVCIAFAVLLTTSFFVVNYVLLDELENYSKTVLYFYSDLVVYDSDMGGFPLDCEHSEKMKFYGDYISSWYNVDYTYMMIPHIEKGTATLCDISLVNLTDWEKEAVENLIGTEFSYDFEEEEIDVYTGKADCAFIITDTYRRDEFVTIIKTDNDYGEPLLAGIAISYSDIRSKIFKSFGILAALMLLFTALIVIFIYRLIIRRVQEPAEAISEHMQRFVREGFKNSEKMEVDSSKEFAMISSSFNSMNDSIESYIEDIKNLNSSKDMMQSEFDMAATLQKSILPPERLEHEEFYINAKMVAAREVGGDLYDYLDIDDTHTLLVIADVSGKGLAASIFMAMSLALIRQCARFGLTPGQMLEQTNDLLVPRNEEMLFVTTFIGIYNKETGVLTYSNAGHNRPYVLGKELITLEEAAGPALGVFENEKYEDSTVKLNMGDIVFLYTDGVTESTGNDREFYGTKRLEQALISFMSSGCNNPVDYVYGEIEQFSGDDAQYDDITMLALTTRKCSKLDLTPDISEFEKIKQLICNSEVDDKLKKNLCVAAEEYFTNICYYAFDGVETDNRQISFSLEYSGKIVMQLIDNGIPFDPTKEVMENADDYDFDTQIGGFGRFIASSVADDVTYEYKDNRNVLTITKYDTGKE